MHIPGILPPGSSTVIGKLTTVILLFAFIDNKVDHVRMYYKTVYVYMCHTTPVLLSIYILLLIDGCTISCQTYISATISSQCIRDAFI